MTDQIDTSPEAIERTAKLMDRVASSCSPSSGHPMAAQLRAVAAGRDEAQKHAQDLYDEIVKLRVQTAALRTQLDSATNGLKNANESWLADIKRADALDVELKNLKSDRQFVVGFNEGYEKAENELQAEMAQMQDDARRYRWLRDRDLETIHQGGVFAGKTPDNLVLNGADLDQAIDRAQEREGEA